MLQLNWSQEEKPQGEWQKCKAEQLSYLNLPVLPQLKKMEPGQVGEKKEHREENYKGFSSPFSDCPPSQPSPSSFSFSVAILGFLHKLNPVFQIGQWKVFAMLKSFPELNWETWGSQAVLQLAGMWLQ